MSILGIINVVLFVLLVIKCGLGRGIGYIIGNWVFGLIFGLIAGVAVWIISGSLAMAKIAVGITQFVVTIWRMNKAIKDVR